MLKMFFFLFILWFRYEKYIYWKIIQIFVNMDSYVGVIFLFYNLEYFGM